MDKNFEEKFLTDTQDKLKDIITLLLKPPFLDDVKVIYHIVRHFPLVS